jgi:hypothetical protein
MRKAKPFHLAWGLMFNSDTDRLAAIGASGLTYYLYTHEKKVGLSVCKSVPDKYKISEQVMSAKFKRLGPAVRAAERYEELAQK